MVGIIFYWIYRALQVYLYILIGSILMSWVPELRRTRIGQLIDKIASPFMNLFRGIIVIGMFDFTPMVGLILYQLGLSYLAQMVNMMLSQGI